jgi:hypothetical protein
MSGDKIKEWMREAGAGRGAIVPETYDGVVDIFARVVERAVADEREAIIALIEAYKITVGYSAAGEMACEWTMDALRDLRDAIRARGEK